MSFEADAHLKAAAKAIRTNYLLLKFHPDYDEAALKFQEAAECFKSIQNFPAEINALKEAANCRRLEGDHFGAGRLYEQAGKRLFLALENYEDGCQVLDQAANSYRIAGKPESAVRVWLKIAELVEVKTSNVEIAISAYQRCIEIYEIEDNNFMVIDTLKTYAAFLSRCFRESNNNCFEKELQVVLDKLMSAQALANQTAQFAKTVLSKFILFLLKSDIVAAEKTLQEGVELLLSFRSTNEYQAGGQMVAAWNEGDLKEFTRLRNTAVITYLPVEIVRLSKRIVAPNLQKNLARDSDRKESSNSENEVNSSASQDSSIDIAELLM